MNKGQGRKIGIRFTEAITTTTWETVQNVKLNEFGTPVSSHAGWDGNVVANAFDDNEATAWRPGYRILNCWIGLAFPENQPVEKLVIRSITGTTDRYSEWRLEGNNNGTWETIVTGGHTAAAQTLAYEFSPVIYTEYRIFCTNRVGNYPGFSIIELWGNKLVPANPPAFEVWGNDPLWVDTGGGQELALKSYPVVDVRRKGESLNEILLTIKDRSEDWFRNVIGNLTVKYNADLGNLTGIGGPVESFEVSFLPQELEPKNHPNNRETVDLDIQLPVFDFIKIEYVENDSHEETVGFDVQFPTFALIHIDDIEV